MSVRDILTSNNDWWFGDFFRAYKFRRWQYFRIRSIIEDKNPASILLLGMRRTGKTIILKQLVSDLCEEFGNIAVYLPVDELALRMGHDSILDSVEWFLRAMHPGGRPIVVALDEAQYYDNWSLEVKVLFDKLAHKTDVFFIISGSSSLGLITGASEGLVGRSRILRIYPMGLLEILGLLRQEAKIGKYINMIAQEYYDNLAAGKSKDVEEILDKIAINLNIRDTDLDKALQYLFTYGSLPQTVEMIRRGEDPTEIHERLLEIVDLTIMRDILRLLKKYPSRYELEPIEAQTILHIIAYNSPYLTSTNAISKSLGISWRKIDLAIKLGTLAGIIGTAHNYAKSPIIRERKKLKKLFISDIGIRNAIRLRLDPRKITTEEIGMIIENIILAQLQKIAHILGEPNPKVYFWRMNNKEIDAVAILKNTLLGIETKRKKRKTNLKDFEKYAPENTKTYLIDEKEIKKWALI